MPAGPDDFERMRVFYESLLNVGCQAVIFHDELSDAFTSRWTGPNSVPTWIGCATW